MPARAPVSTDEGTGGSTQADDTEMSVDGDVDSVVVARVRLSLADGLVEEWMVPMELTDDALSYHAAIYPPEGAVVVAVDAMKRQAAARQDLVVARADVASPSDHPRP